MARQDPPRVVRARHSGARRYVDKAIRHPATRWLLRNTPLSSIRSKVRWREDYSRWIAHDAQLIQHNGSLMYPVDDRAPYDARDANAEVILSVLDETEIPYTFVRNTALIRATIAIPSSYCSRLLKAMARKYSNEAIYAAVIDEYVESDDDDDDITIRSPSALGRQRLSLRALAKRSHDPAVFRVWRYFLEPSSGLVYGPRYSCEIELWEEGDHDFARWSAPRLNAAGDVFSSSDVSLVPRKRHVDAPKSVFDTHMVNDIDFPIDVVYTWVDSSDADWRERFQLHRGTPASDDVHENAKGEERFRSRNELKYSLRSLSMFAPWVRHLYIVTDDQVPEFIDFGRDDITLVDHKDISTAPEALPVFNSSAIISWLHHIPGLSEHYIYMNDDVFIGRDATPERFFNASGLAKVFPSRNRRPFGSATIQDEPHINITRNIRDLLEREFGRTVSRSVKHTPHAQRVSVQQEMEKRFPDAYHRTSRSRFRHHSDIAADQLFHYYGQITGHAIVGRIRYAYVNIGEGENVTELDRLLATRTRETFCLNDAPAEGSTPIPDRIVRNFLDTYFPIPSRWER